MIYLDNAATSPMRPEVRDAMLPYLESVFGNPSGLYAVGREAQAAVDAARTTVAACLGAARPSGLDEHDAVVAAHALFGMAGRIAGHEAVSPGSFRTAWIDALHGWKPGDIGQWTTITEA